MPARKRRIKRWVCFVVSPIGSDGSPERRKADYLLRKIIRPALVPLGFRVPMRIDQLHVPGEINDNIVNELKRADLVVVDLTDLNPNVMFEFGIRRAWALPLVPIAPSGEKIPFDVAGINTVRYPQIDKVKNKLTPKQLENFRKRLARMATRAMKILPTGAFAKAMTELSNERSLEIVFNTKQRVFISLDLHMRRIRSEAERDPGLEEGNVKAIRRFEAMLKEDFAILQEQFNVLHAMAEAEDNGDRSEYCLRVCKIMNNLQKMGKDAAKALRKLDGSNGSWRIFMSKLHNIEKSIADALKLIRERPS